MTYTDFLGMEKVTAFLDDVGVDYRSMVDEQGEATDETLFHYVPRQLIVQLVRPDLAKGEIGSASQSLLITTVAPASSRL